MPKEKLKVEKKTKGKKERNVDNIDIPLCFTDFYERVKKKTTAFTHTNTHLCLLFSFYFMAQLNKTECKYVTLSFGRIFEHCT